MEEMHHFAARLEYRIKHLEKCAENYKQTVAALQDDLKKADAAAILRKRSRNSPARRPDRAARK